VINTQIGVAAHSEIKNGKHVEIAKELIRALRENCGNDHVILLGGYWGLMKVLADEALNKGFKVAMLLPIEREGIEIPEKVIKIYTGCEFRCRSVMLVRSSDALISIGGGVGTQIEIAMAYAMGKPVFVLTNTGMPTDNLPLAFPEYLDDRKVVRVQYFKDVEELVKSLCSSRLRSVKTDFG
jgi:hypothetical protein